MLLSLLVATTLGTAPAPTASDSGAQWIRKVHAAHAASWFRTMTFIQKTTYPQRKVVETWYETMATPGMLRIDIAADTGIRQSVIFRNDSVFVQAGGAVRVSRPMVHTMLAILADLHVQAPEVTAAKLAANGYDLTKTHRTTWKGRPVVVIGATAGDTTSNQFWLDPERLLPVRMIEKTPNGRLMDAHVGGHRQEGTAWVEREILIHQDGVLDQIEEYTWVKTNVTLDERTFDPAAPPPAWVGEQRVANGERRTAN